MAQPGRRGAAAEAWFREHGLPYFVDDVRTEVRRRLHRSRLVLVLLVSLAVGAAVGVVARAPGRGDGGSAGFTAGPDRGAGDRVALRPARLQTAYDRPLGGRTGVREPRPAGAPGDQGAADAAAVPHLLLHQHRDLAGRGRAELGRAGRHGAVLRPGRGVLPGRPAGRGARRGRRHRRRRGGRRGLRRYAARGRGPRARGRAHRPRRRHPGRRPREGQPGAGAGDRPGRPGPAALGRGLAVLRGLRVGGHRRRVIESWIGHARTSRSCGGSSASSSSRSRSSWAPSAASTSPSTRSPTRRTASSSSPRSCASSSGRSACAPSTAPARRPDHDPQVTDGGTPAPPAPAG